MKRKIFPKSCSLKGLLSESWKEALNEFLETRVFNNLKDFINKEYSNREENVFPAYEDIFSALNIVDPKKVKVVILGQDPYHQAGQANGFAFSVNESIKMPPSLRNIYKEIGADLGVDTKKRNGDLRHWARQGVLLLNSVLTVQEGSPASHSKKGWEDFTDEIIKKISDNHEGIVFMLWGSYAQKKGASIDTSKHLVLKSSHPSPLSSYRGFIGCGHFSKTNKFLEENKIKKIIW